MTFGPQTSILVDRENDARLADFEFPVVICGIVMEETGHTTTLAAPEVLEGVDVIARDADVFSFAILVEVRLCSGEGG